MKKYRLQVVSLAFFLAVSLLIIQCEKKKPMVKETEPPAQTENATPGGPGCGCQQAQVSPEQPDTGAAKAPPAKEKQDLIKVIVILEKGDQAGHENVEGKIKELGGRVTASMLPAGLYALIPPGKEAELKALKEIKLVSSKAVDPGKTPGLSDRQKALLKDWNKNLTNTREPTLIPNPPPPPGDARTRPKTDQKNVDAHPPKEIPDEEK